MRNGRLMLGFFLSTLQILPAPLAAQEPTTSNAQWKWLEENFEKALDRAMPLQKDVSVVVSYRLRETLQVGQPEYSFAITQGTASASLSVHVRTAANEPIGKQLLALHRRFPRESLAVLGKKLKFVDSDLTEQQCPALKDAVRKLNTIPIALQFDSTTIILDPTLHELFIRSNEGSILAAIVDPNKALVKWAQETRTVIQMCGNKSVQ